MTDAKISTLEQLNSNLTDSPESESITQKLEQDISDVEVQGVELQVEKIERRQRQIQARIQLPYSPEQVWQVLTNYEALSDFIPNLETSRRIEHPDGGIRIEQVGAQSALMLKFSARVVLDMEECFPEQLNFNMVEGDFKAFQGNWHLVASPSGQATELIYTVTVWPKRSMPILAVEKRLSKDLPKNLQSIRLRLDKLFKADS